MDRLVRRASSVLGCPLISGHPDSTGQLLPPSLCEGEVSQIRAVRLHNKHNARSSAD
ncbi:hypothetical protein D4764_14G0009550 [Takifugu flavidus]|uniref:Uncharacterized protein n=1 Tax=Takifugu flavidus TaxID=433684 RepID=A0A5C6P5C9_9TELE|nr:hypothetical protein D4764_14G0009550 [Takifugu flavidus]